MSKKLNELIKNKCIDLGITKYDFATDVLGMHYQTFDGMVKGTKQTKIYNIVKLAQALGISNRELIDLIQNGDE